MRKLIFGMLLVLLSATAHSAEPVELATFPESKDQVVQACYDIAADATTRGKALCVEGGYGDYWICPQSREMRLQALEQCKASVSKANDQPEMLYLLGLLHQDFNFQPEHPECPEFYRFQEGSGVCVYTNDHFDQLIEKFPSSEYSDMSGFKKAQVAYRYYECEGQVLCSIENAICGWVDFLRERPASDLAGLATDRIVEPLNSLSTAKLDPQRESPDGLRNDVANLRTIAGTLSLENRRKLTRALDAAEASLLQLQSAQQ